KVADKSAEDHDKMGWRETFHADPVSHFLLVCLFASLWFILPDYANFAALITAGAIALRGTLLIKRHGLKWDQWHDRLLRNWAPFTVLAFIAVAIGGAVQIIPGVVAHKAASVEDRVQVPYTPLELAGRDIYISEGCYNCHSQMIRTLVPDVMRYGDYSRLGESIYDHPFQWGSRRIGPDLARVGGKYPNIWHYRHMDDPRAISATSNMPNYPWLLEAETDVDALPTKIRVQRTLGVPYPQWTDEEIQTAVDEQATGIARDLRTAGAY